MEWAGRQLGVGNAAVLMGLSIPKPSRDHPKGLPVGFRVLPKRAGGAFPSVCSLSLPILPFLFVFPALYINKEKIIHIILRRKDLPMVAGSDRSYLRAFGLSHNPVFPLRVPRFSSPTHHFPTPSTCFSSLASLFFFFSPLILLRSALIASESQPPAFPPFSLLFPLNALCLPCFCQITRKTTNFRKLFFRNIWRVLKNAVPLHPLFRTKHTPRKGER